MTEITSEKRIAVLARFLDEEDLTQFEVTAYNDKLIAFGNQEYLVLTDEEADEAAKEHILDSLWAFNTNFILEHTDIESDDRIESAIQKMQEVLCESANDIVKAIINDIDEFVDDAISSDGRGHFLSDYDGEENEQEEFYIYRTN